MASKKVALVLGGTILIGIVVILCLAGFYFFQPGNYTGVYQTISEPLPEVSKA